MDGSVWIWTHATLCDLNFMQLPYPLHYRTFFWWWMYWEDLCPLQFVSIDHCLKKANKKQNKNEWLCWDLNPCTLMRLELLEVFLTTTPWKLLLVKGALRWFIPVTGWSNLPRSQRLHWVVVEKFSPLIFFLEGGKFSGLRSSGDHLVGMPFVIRVLVLIICLCPMVVPETCVPGLGRPCKQQSILRNHRIGHHAFDWADHAVSIIIPYLPLGQIGFLIFRLFLRKCLTSNLTEAYPLH